MNCDITGYVAPCMHINNISGIKYPTAILVTLDNWR